MAARTDFQKYRNALETCVNCLPLAQGGAMRRPGTRFVVELKSSTAMARLKAFEFSTTQAYMLEFGPGYIRFCKDQAQIVTEATNAVITNGTFDSDASGWDDRSTGSASIAHDATNLDLNLVGATGGVAWAEQDVVIDSQYLNHPHVIRFRVVGIAGDTVQLRIGNGTLGSGIISDVEFDTGYHCYQFTPQASPTYIGFRNTAAKTVSIDDISIINGAPVEIGNPYAEADLRTVEGPQNADVLYLCHKSYPVHKLERSGHFSWSLVQVDWNDGPWLATNTVTTKTLAANSTSGLGITITAAGHAPFVSTDVGRLIRIQQEGGTTWGSAVITAVTSATVVTADVQNAFGNTSASDTWRLGAWSATTGYPQAATFHEQRLVLGGNTARPQTLWFSQSADAENMRPDNGSGTVADDDAMDFTISADKVNAIQWIASARDLIIGTVGGEFRATSSGASITPTDIDVKRQSGHGSAKVQPIVVGEAILFLQRAKRKIRELGFRFEVDGYRALDMTRLADHITKSGIVEMAYQQEPDSTLWCLRDDGVLAALTYLRDEDVVGWSRHILGGSFEGGDTVVESVAVIPGNSTTNSEGRDEVWMIGKRTVNGVTKRYIEFFEGAFEHGDTQADAFYVDCGLTYDASPVTSISGLDHLANETVAIWADGAIQPEAQVIGGNVALGSSAAKAQIGLPYPHTLKTLKVESGSSAGTAVGKTKRIHGVTAVVLDSHTIDIGPETDDLKFFDFREVSDAMDTGTPLFTGERYISFNGNYATDTRIIIESDAPAPFFLLALAPELKTSDVK